MPDNRTPGDIFCDHVEHWSFRFTHHGCTPERSLVLAIALEMARCIAACEEEILRQALTQR